MSAFSLPYPPLAVQASSTPLFPNDQYVIRYPETQNPRHEPR